MNQARALSIKSNSLEYTQAKQIGIGKEWKMFYVTKKWNLPEFPLQFESNPGSQLENKLFRKHSN